MKPNSYFIPNSISVGAFRLIKELEAAIEKDRLHPIEDRLEKFIQSNVGDDRRVAFVVSDGNGYYLKPIEDNPAGWIVIAQEKEQ